jgi:hypothetical protein
MILLYSGDETATYMRGYQKVPGQLVVTLWVKEFPSGFPGLS